MFIKSCIRVLTRMNCDHLALCHINESCELIECFLLLVFVIPWCGLCTSFLMRLSLNSYIASAITKFPYISVSNY